MIEDKLLPLERLRLECLNQAVSTRICTSGHEVLATAKLFEEYVAGGHITPDAQIQLNSAKASTFRTTAENNFEGDEDEDNQTKH